MVIKKYGLLRNYGLFWHRDDVFWGWQKNTGHMKGRRAGKKTSEPVDFRKQVGLYALYDESYRLVYFGQAGKGNGRKLFDRLKDHLNDRIADRWSRFSWFGTRYVKTTDNKLSTEKANINGDMELALDHMEAIVLAVAEPPHNRQGGRFGKDVHQFIQYRDENALDLSEKHMITELHRKLVSEGNYSDTPTPINSS